MDESNAHLFGLGRIYRAIVFTVELHPSLIRPDDATYNVHQRAFACTVLTYNAQQFARLGG